MVFHSNFQRPGESPRQDEVFLAPQAVQRAVRTAMRCANGAPERGRRGGVVWKSGRSYSREIQIHIYISTIKHSELGLIKAVLYI